MYSIHIAAGLEVKCVTLDVFVYADAIWTNEMKDTVEERGSLYSDYKNT